jgi:G3E family GTPase
VLNKTDQLAKAEMLDNLKAIASALNPLAQVKDFLIIQLTATLRALPHALNRSVL